jgi:hypothetical protein
MQRSSSIPVFFPLLASLIVTVADAQSLADAGRRPEAPLTCRFHAGPRAGQTQDVPAEQNASSARIGGTCSDGASSIGTLVPSSTDSRDAAVDAGAAAAPGTALTSICQFSAGPRAGEIVDFAKAADMRPIPVGSACSDGASSSGTAIAAPTSTGATPWSSGAIGSPGASSTICQFMSGPKAHGWHDYAPLTAAALGNPCRDGVGSAGIVVAKGHGQQY